MISDTKDIYQRLSPLKIKYEEKKNKPLIKIEDYEKLQRQENSLTERF